MKLLLSLLCAVALLAQTASDKSRQAVDLLLEAKYAELFERFSPEMKKAVSLEALTQAANRLKVLGPVKKRLDAEVSRAGDLEIAVFPVEYGAAAVNIRVVTNPAGEIAGLLLQPRMPAAPPYESAPYSRPEQFRTEEITLGKDWPLPGTLTVPAGKGPFPALVLVHGSGPNDRDETLLGNKPFRDLAEGLASRGIAVLRYEKRTRQHGARMAAMDSLTVREETVEDAVAAAALLRARPGVDAGRVCVLGHSLGGYLLPRIAKADPGIPCLISLAGPARPLEDLLVEQIAYIGSATEKQLAETKLLVERIKGLKPGDTSKPGELLGAGAAYWLDLKGYDPAAEARGLKAPMLILQGERDYQVTMTDFARWKDVLGARKDVVFKSYPALNHLFMEGAGRSTPAEYQKPGHVSVAALDDIAAWVSKLPPPAR